MRNWNLSELRVRVNLPSPIQQVQVPIRQVITPLHGLLIPVRQVVPLISQVHSYRPYHSHLHPPSLALSSTPLASVQEYKVKSSLSISPRHQDELTLSAAYAVCSIHRVEHTPEIVCHSFILTISYDLQRRSHLITFPRFRVNQPVNRVTAPGAPSIDRL